MHRWVPGYLAGCALQCPHSVCFPHQMGQKRKKRQCTNVQVWEGGPVWPMQPPSPGPPYSSPLHANQQATWSTYIIVASGSKQKRHLLPYPFRPRIPAPSNRRNALRLFALATAVTNPPSPFTPPPPTGLALHHSKAGIMASGYDMGIDTSRRNVKPRPLTDNERARLEEFLESIHYSSRSVMPLPVTSSSRPY